MILDQVLTSVASLVTSCVCGVPGSASKSHASCEISKSSSCAEANTLPSPAPQQGSSMFSMNKVAGSRHRVQRKSVAGADGGLARRASLIGDDTTMELLLKAQQEAGSPDARVEKGSKYDVIDTNLTGAKTGGDGRSGYTNGVSRSGRAEGEFSLAYPKVSIQGREFPVAVPTFSPSNGAPTPRYDTGNSMMPADGWNSALGLPFFGEASPTHAPPMAKPGGGCCSSGRLVSQTPQTNIGQCQSTIPKPMASCCNGGGSHGGNFVAKPELSRVPIPNPEFFAPPQYNTTYNTTSPLEAPLPRPIESSTVTLTAREFAWVQYLRATGFSSPPPPPVGAGLFPGLEMMGRGEENRQSAECNCGPDCNCLGCISHPYNPRTVEYVRGLRSFALDDQPISPFHSQSNSPTLSSPHPNGLVNGVGEAGGSTGSAHRHAVTTKANINLIIQTPPPPPSPDGESSAGVSENGVSPSAFVLVDYQIGPCSEAETECKCGDGCICLSCSSHGKNHEVETVGNARWDASGLGDAGAGIAAGPNWWGFGSNGSVETNPWNSV